MDIFEVAATFTKPWEGGYVNNPKDPGGETKFGISKRSYPNLDIKNLTWDQARGIWRTDFWNKIHCDALPKEIAVVLFDFGLNSGSFRAVKMLQRVLGVPQDGIMGPQTIEKAKALNSRRVALDLITARAEFLLRIPGETFDVGWIRRVLDLNNLIWQISAEC